MLGRLLEIKPLGIQEVINALHMELAEIFFPSTKIAEFTIIFTVTM